MEAQEKPFSPAHSTTERVAGAAHETVDHLAEHAAQAEERVRRGTERAETYGKDAADSVTRYVQEHPLASLGIAAAAGFVLSALLRR